MKTKANTRKGTSAQLLNPRTLQAPLPHDEIAFAAYCLWEQEGRPQQHDWDHWFRAERLLQQAAQRT